MLMGTGGNCGSQSSTLVIRGLAVGEIEFRDMFKVIFKEVRVAVADQSDLIYGKRHPDHIMGQGRYR